VKHGVVLHFAENPCWRRCVEYVSGTVSAVVSLVGGHQLYVGVPADLMVLDNT
jgi:hypothetical protein